MTDQHTPLTSQQLDEIETRAARLYEYSQQGDGEGDTLAGEDVPALLAEVARLRAALATPRTLTESQHNRAWHAIEGAAGEDMADPGTVLNAVLHALGITPPGAPAVSGAADSRQP